MKFSKKISLYLLMMSIFVSMNTNSWLQMWILLEINMMSFIPLLFNPSSKSINAMLKYFFIQALASSLFMASILMMASVYTTNSNNLLLMAMTIKLGSFPLFMWFPQVANMISWNNNIILMTIQKFLPMLMMNFISISTIIMNIIITMSSIISTLGIWTQKSLQKIMAFSSINHMSWMFLGILTKTSFWITYLTIYSMIMYITLNHFKTFNIYSLSQVNVLMMKHNAMYMIINLWSLGGIPPLLGFIPKWLMISTINETFLSTLFIVILFSLFNMMLYTRMLYPLLLNPFFMKLITMPNFTSLMSFHLFPFIILILI